MVCELEATGGTKSVDRVLLGNVPVRFRAYLDRRDVSLTTSPTETTKKGNGDDPPRLGQWSRASGQQDACHYCHRARGWWSG